VIVGADACGFCGVDGNCTTNMVVNANRAPTIFSDCAYHHQTLKYKQAAHSGHDGKCSNVPVVCTVDECGATVWKYNAIIHLWFVHGDGNRLPPISTQFWVEDIWIPQVEEEALGIRPELTRAYRAKHGVQRSVDIENLKHQTNEVRVTRPRSHTVGSASSDAHLPKRMRIEEGGGKDEEPDTGDEEPEETYSDEVAQIQEESE
jgi:hypothetical protein